MSTDDPAPVPVYKFRSNGNHYNGGMLFYGYGYSAIGEPRFSMIRKTYKSGAMRGRTVDEVYIDGMLCADYAAAVAALATPPVFTDAEIAALRLIGDEPADVRKAIGWETLHYLGEKGAIKWDPPGSCARTDVGRAALAAADANAV